MLETYLSSREGEELTVTAKVKVAVEALDSAGGQIDTVWRRLQLARIDETDRRSLAEELNQTLSALSRELWAAHGAGLAVLSAMAQLAEVEARLETSLQAAADAKARGIDALTEARDRVAALELELGVDTGKTVPAAPTPVPADPMVVTQPGA